MAPKFKIDVRTFLYFKTSVFNFFKILNFEAKMFIRKDEQLNLGGYFLNKVTLKVRISYIKTKLPIRRTKSILAYGKRLIMKNIKLQVPNSNSSQSSK
jgi:hypothetical protein